MFGGQNRVSRIGHTGRASCGMLNVVHRRGRCRRG